MKPTIDPYENPGENEFVIYATNKRLKIEFVLVWDVIYTIILDVFIFYHNLVREILKTALWI